MPEIRDRQRRCVKHRALRGCIAATLTMRCPCALAAQLLLQLNWACSAKRQTSCTERILGSKWTHSCPRLASWPLNHVSGPDPVLASSASDMRRKQAFRPSGIRQTWCPHAIPAARHCLTTPALNAIPRATCPWHLHARLVSACSLRAGLLPAVRAAVDPGPTWRFTHPHRNGGGIGVDAQT